MKEPVILPVGMIGTNCYILGSGDTGVVIDPGDEAQKILDVLREQGITPKYILLTHGHYDHIGAVQALSLIHI